MLVTRINSLNNQKILISPLNWGFGHVSRTIPIIKQLLKQNNEIIICCSTEQEVFYRNYFPQLCYVPFRDYPFVFTGKGNWINDIFKTLVELQKFITWEKNQVSKLVDQFDPDVIISDQRFGFRNQKVKSIIITHQVNFQLPWWAQLANFLNRQQLRKFNEVWIPDNPDRSLSGQLSKWKNRRVHFVGWQSRLKQRNNSAQLYKYKYLGIVSGPQPYSNQLADQLIQVLGTSIYPTAILSQQTISKECGKCVIYKGDNQQEIQQLFDESEILISYAGYSTLMDLSVIQKKAILIPTPGQSEQKYLSTHHMNHLDWKFVTSLSEIQIEK